MRVFACNVVSKLQQNRCITFGDWRSRKTWPLHFYIYRYIYIYIYIYIQKLHLPMRVFACHVVSKLQRNRCITFGDWRSWKNLLDNRLTDGSKIVSPTHQPHFECKLFFWVLSLVSFTHPGKQPRVSIRYEAGWDPERVWTLWRT
jgi:hypothetical protein